MGKKFVERKLYEWIKNSRRMYYTSLRVEEVGFIPRYTWKDIEKRGTKVVPALYFVVKNFDNDHRHVVVLSINPFESKSSPQFAIWCGDKELKEKLGLSHQCSFWKKKGCKHTEHVLESMWEVLNYKEPSHFYETVSDFIKAVKDYLSPTSSPSFTREEEVRRILELGLPALIYGPTGSGKTHTVLKILLEKQRAGEVEFTVINLSSGIEDVDLLGKYVPLPNGGWEIRDGELWRAFKEASQLPDGKRYVIVLEEVSRASAKALNLLVKALDGVGRNYRLQNFLTGEELIIPKDKLLFVGTANLGSSYSGTEELDPALMRRFLITRFWDYDTEAERNLLRKLGLDEDTVEKVMKFVQSQRDGYKQGEFPYPIDTGTLRKWVEVKTSTQMGWWDSFEFTTLYRIVDRDSLGYPDESQIEELKSMMELVGLEGGEVEIDV